MITIETNTHSIGTPWMEQNFRMALKYPFSFFHASVTYVLYIAVMCIMETAIKHWGVKQEKYRHINQCNNRYTYLPIFINQMQSV